MTCLSHHLGLARCIGIVALLVCGCGLDTGGVPMTAPMGGQEMDNPLPRGMGFRPLVTGRLRFMRLSRRRHRLRLFLPWTERILGLSPH